MVFMGLIIIYSFATYILFALLETPIISTLTMLFLFRAGLINMKEYSDTQEDIEKASKASGAKKMLEDLAKKMQGSQPVKNKIEDY